MNHVFLATMRTKQQGHVATHNQEGGAAEAAARWCEGLAGAEVVDLLPSAAHFNRKDSSSTGVATISPLIGGHIGTAKRATRPPCSPFSPTKGVLNQVDHVLVHRRRMPARWVNARLANGPGASSQT